MIDKEKNKKGIGGLSIKDLKSIFLRSKKENIPKLEEDFKKRRYHSDEFSTESSMIDSQTTGSRNISNLRRNMFKRVIDSSFSDENYSEDIYNPGKNSIQKEINWLSRSNSFRKTKKPYYGSNENYLLNIRKVKEIDYHYKNDDYLIDHNQHQHVEDFNSDLLIDKIKVSKKSKYNKDDIDDFIDKYKKK